MVGVMVARATLQTAGELASKGVPFQGSNLKGVVVPEGHYYHGGLGRLPARFTRMALDRNVDYVVVSYGTPILWRREGVWLRPNVRYSVSTSRQQGAFYQCGSVDIDGVADDGAPLFLSIPGDYNSATVCDNCLTRVV